MELDGITLLLVPSPEASHDAEHGGQREGAHDDTAGADAHDEDDHRLVVQDLGRVVGVAVGGTALDAAQLVEVAGQRAGVDLLELLVAWVGWWFGFRSAVITARPGMEQAQHAPFQTDSRACCRIGESGTPSRCGTASHGNQRDPVCACRVTSCECRNDFRKNGTMQSRRTPGLEQL